MSNWHSLTGYLHYKSGNNALGRLITKRKVWCVLEESKCQLHYYKTDDDFHKHKPSLGHLDLTGAAISLDLEHQNQFAVICDGKEHIFTAENHESMMIWLLGLQAKRDLQSRKKIPSPQDKDESLKYSEADLLESHRPSLFMTCDLHGTELLVTQNIQSSLSTSRRKHFSEQYGSNKWGESVDSGIGSYRKRLEASKSFPMSVSQHKFGVSKQISASHAMLYHDNSDSDDVFGGENSHKPKKPAISMSHWKKLQTAVMGQVLQNNTGLTSESTGIESGERNSLSSRSMSSDSAIEKGEGTPRELSARLMELEKDLISTKCELAKVLNRQTGFQELLQHKDETIKQLEVGTDGKSTDINKKDNKKMILKRQKSEKEFSEKIRVLQNQNRFLNEEVKKLAKIRLQEHGHFQEQNSRLQSLEAEIEKWKMDYVCLIQSSIRYPGEEGVEDLELCLYGGDKHKRRVQALLEEARKINPRLPTFESLSNNEAHVDNYGFKHVYCNTGLLLHYLCTELTHHYLVQAGVYEDHQRRWTMFMRQHGKDPMPCQNELKILCRGGIPDRFRKQMWHHLVHYKVRHIIKEKGDYYYRNLCNLLPESPLAACYRKQVSLDLMRTMPSNVKFTTMGSKGIMDLQDVLLSFCVHNPTIGYCQGMNFIVGMALIFMDPEDAFWTLVAIAECYFSPHYFDHNLIGAQADQQVLKDMVKDKLPRLSEHLEGIDIELSTVTLNWFLAVFFDAVPFQTLLRVWDCFLLEGPKVLFRFSLAILKLHENDILQKTDTMGIMKHLKTCAKLTYDVEGLVKFAFEDLKPFPKRKDIVTKETCYLNALKEKHKKKELQRLAFAEREQLYMSMEAETGSFLGIECAVAIEAGKIWVCYGDQHIGHLCFVSCEHGTMISMEYKLDSRMMCMCPMGKNRLVLGTLSWMLVCLEVNKQQQMWQMQLHDAILSVCCYEDEEAMAVRIFSGLADGTVAVAEKMNNKSEPNLDVIYIPIGQAPVTCTMLLDDQLWCASGNSVAVIHAKTLDTMDIFSVSINPYDHILSLIPSEYGIWISLRGSSILELWDPKSLNCRMLYDTRTDRYPQLRKEDDAYFNRARITSMLAYDNTVWVGTGEGNMIIYEVLESAQLKTPTESVSMETTSTKSCIARPDRKIGTSSLLMLNLMEDREIFDRCTPDSLEVIPDVSERMRLDSFPEDEEPSSYETNPNRNRSNFRRRSSSENNMAALQNQRYLEDSLATIDRTSYKEGDKNRLEIENSIFKKVPSVNDIGRLQLSHESTVDYTENTEELECEMEAVARRESLTLMIEQSATRKSSLGGCSAGGRSCIEAENKNRRSSLNREIQKLQMNKSEDSGCESKTRSFQTHTSDSSRHSLKTRKNEHHLMSYDSNTGNPEGNDFEMELEKAAMRESLKHLKIDQKDIPLLRKRNHMNSVTDKGSVDNDTGSDSSSCNMVNDRAACGLERSACRSNKSVTIGRAAFQDDDNYISSSTDCCTKDDNETKRTTALGISFDSDDGFDSKKVGHHLICNNVCREEEGENQLGMENNGNLSNSDKTGSSDRQDGRNRRPSVIEDISQLCFECKKLETEKCAACSNLLTGQESLKKIERRMSNVDKGDIEQMVGKLNGVVKTNDELNHEGTENGGSHDQELDKKVVKHRRNSYSEACEYEQNLLKDQDRTQSDNNETGRSFRMFPESRERKDLTRQEKVGFWLSAISQEDSLLVSMDGDDVVVERDKVGQISNGTDKSSGEEKVTSPKRPKTLQLGHKLNSQYAPRTKGKYGGSVGSDESSSVTRKSSSKSDSRYGKDDPGTQYRLDFSGTHVGIDMDSEDTRSASKDQASQDMSVDYMMKQSGSDSRKNSLDLGVIQENCKRLESHVSKVSDRCNGNADELCKPNERQRIFEFLKTPSLATRHMSLGLKIIDNDLEWTGLFTGQYTTPSPGSSTDQRLADFLRTPTISSRPSSLWSSYENISTPSQIEPMDPKLLHPNINRRGRLSHSASTVSMGSENDLIYNVDLNLEAKVKISDKPVKFLLPTSCKDEPIIMSFSGSYGDDEAVLKWRKHKNEQIWTNEPILELCPRTRAAILPSYMRRRLSSASSFTSHTSHDSGVNLHK